MDWKLPEMDGFEVSRHIKQHPGIHRTPAIIMVTAYGREEMMQKSEAEGLDGFLIKPVNPSMLFDMIMQTFGKDKDQQPKVSYRKDQETGALKAIDGAHILLVEDNEINQQVAREILAGAGFKVSIANNGLEAVNLVKESVYDAVLMDVQMPVMDGYEATRKIRELQLTAHSSKLKADDEGIPLGSGGQQPATSDQRLLPIIAMTAHAMTGDHEKSLEAGMVDHVTKPIDPEHLFATLLKWIQPRKMTAGDSSLESVINEKQSTTAAAESTLLSGFNTPTGQEAFPTSLPGFNLDEGLKRLQGNQELYKKLLLNFGDNYSNATHDIRQALDSADYENAHQLVHSLKGVAANLAAGRVKKATIELEKLVKHADANSSPVPESIDSKLDLLKNALDQALGAVETLKTGDEAKNTELLADLSALPPVDVDKETIRRLRDAAEMGDVTEVVAIADEIASQANGFSPYRARIAQLADDFDFDGILQLTDQLENPTDLSDL
jgi:CheY-like chemotaxis protein